MDPYFSTHVHLTITHDDGELNHCLKHFQVNQGAGYAMINPLQTPHMVAIGFFARQSPAMIFRPYIVATNTALMAADHPPVLLMWGSALNPPASEWDTFVNIKPASALVAYSHAKSIAQATAGLRHLYSDPSTSPPLGRQMFFCPMTEFWAQPVSFICHQVLDQHLKLMMCEDIISEAKGLHAFPNADSSSTL
jgi:hypothetical protein